MMIMPCHIFWVLPFLMMMMMAVMMMVVVSRPDPWSTSYFHQWSCRRAHPVVKRADVSIFIRRNHVHTFFPFFLLVSRKTWGYILSIKRINCSFCCLTKKNLSPSPAKKKKKTRSEAVSLYESCKKRPAFKAVSTGPSTKIIMCTWW